MLAIDGLALTAAVILIGAVLAGVAALATLVHRESAVERRLKPASAGPEQVASAGVTELVVHTLAPLSKLAQPTTESELSSLRHRLTRAGLRGRYALELFVASKMLLALTFVVVFMWANALRTRPIEPALYLAALTFALGYYAPSVWLSSRVRRRQASIERALPEALDLLVTCVEAGLGLDAALQRVAREIRRAWPILGGELELAFLEIKAGMPRVESFRRLAHRTGVAELKTLAATLNQTEMFGTSVGLALRIQAEGIRTRRMNRAEERAGYVSVKMAVPLTLCILPTLFAIALGPAILRLVPFFRSLGGGH
jgi:tight adherence protein C